MKKLLAFLLIASFLLADSSGPRGGTGAGAGWTNPTNTASSDNVYATCSIATASTCTSTHNVTAMGFAIPAGATVVGIEVLYEKKCSGNLKCNTNTASGGAVGITGCTGTSNNDGEGMAWTTSDTTTTLGGASDMWGLTCTVAQVNAAPFGVGSVVANSSAISSFTASIDYIAVTVYYSPSGASSRRRIIISQTRSNHPAA